MARQISDAWAETGEPVWPDTRPPIYIDLKPGADPVWVRQCPMTLEARWGSPPSAQAPIPENLETL